MSGRRKLYTADLESGLHYLLRVELAAHRSLAGAELKTLKDFVTVLAKVCCGRGLAAEWVPRPRAPRLWARADPSWTAAPGLQAGARRAWPRAPDGAARTGGQGAGRSGREGGVCAVACGPWEESRSRPGPFVWTGRAVGWPAWHL